MQNINYWDYSSIPPKTWTWEIDGPNHTMSVSTLPHGLRFTGEDWNSLSGGAYFGGFQSYEEFFNGQYAREIPQSVVTEINNYLITNRKEGGSFLSISLLFNIDGFQLEQAFVQLNDKPIKIEGSLEIQKGIPFALHEGSMPPERYELTGLFVLVSKMGFQMKLPLEYTFILPTGKHVSIRLEVNNLESGIGIAKTEGKMEI